ncbi:AI-2E family transporter [Kocuria oceani]|uniref:AI-2E family transporter n=1 Tax=Kocuria oceani TaxID=988827 RepID=UPI00403572B4
MALQAGSGAHTPPSRAPGPLLGRPVAVLVGLAAAVVVVLGMRTMADLLGPAFLALVLTLAAHPVRGWFARRGLPGWVGTAVALVAVYAALLVLTASLVVAGARFATLVPTYQAELDALLDGLVAALAQVGVGQEQISRLLSGVDLGRIASLAGGLLGGLLALLTDLFFIVTLVLFMAVDAASFPGKLAALRGAPGELAVALRHFAATSRKYLLVTTVFGLIVAAVDTLALIWLGVPVAVLWGLLAFITNYIPNIGFVLGLVPPALIGLLEGGPRLMLAVVVVYSLVNVVIQTFIQPKIVGDAVGLSVTVTMLSLVFWAATLGALGALLAVPLTLFFKAVLVDADPRTRWVAPLLSGAGAADAGRDVAAPGAGAPAVGPAAPGPVEAGPAEARPAEAVELRTERPPRVRRSRSSGRPGRAS